MAETTITDPVTYTIDQAAVITYKVTTSDGEDSARRLAGAVNEASVLRTGDEFECTLDIPAGTTLDITTVAPRGPAVVVYATDAAKRDVPVTDEDLHEPLSGALRGELTARLAAYNTAADAPAGDGEQAAAAALAETVAALLARD